MSDLVALREEGELQRLDVVLPGMAENVRKALDEANNSLLVAKERENTASKFAEAQKTYDRALVKLAARWFSVLPEAVKKLPPERKKELEELVLKTATESINEKRILSFLCSHRGLGLCGPGVFWGVAAITGGMVGDIAGVVLGIVGGYIIFFAGACMALSLFDKYSVHEIKGLLESKKLLESQKLLNGDKE